MFNLFSSKNERIIFEARERDKTVQVIERQNCRELRFGNEVVQSARSLLSNDHLLLSYTQAMVLGMVLCPYARDILQIGLGAGNIARFIHKYFPETYQVVLENSDIVAMVAREYFDLPQDEHLRVEVIDGFDGLYSNQDYYDLIFLDAFEADGTPDHLNSYSFLNLIHKHLNNSGWVIGNLWTLKYRFSEQLTLWKEIYPSVFHIPVESYGNVILFGSSLPYVLDKKKLAKTAYQLQKKIPFNFIQQLNKLKF